MDFTINSTTTEFMIAGKGRGWPPGGYAEVVICAFVTCGTDGVLLLRIRSVTMDMTALCWPNDQKCSILPYI